MPTLLFVTQPTDEILYEKGDRAGQVRFPGSEKAVEVLESQGWTVEVMAPEWPKPLRRVEESPPDAVLVSCFKAVPRSRDAASMLSRMTDVPVYTVGVTQKDEAFTIMAPDVVKLVKIQDLPAP